MSRAASPRSGSYLESAGLEAVFSGVGRKGPAVDSDVRGSLEQKRPEVAHRLWTVELERPNIRLLRNLFSLLVGAQAHPQEPEQRLVVLVRQALHELTHATQQPRPPVRYPVGRDRLSFLIGLLANLPLAHALFDNPRRPLPERFPGANQFDWKRST